MRTVLSLVFILCLLSCKENRNTKPEVQDIIDKAIAASGGELYKNSEVSFKFRDRWYAAQLKGGEKVLKRITRSGDSIIEDIKTHTDFRRLVNGEAVVLPDTLAQSFANSVNSVHYFAYLPYGLNDPAVRKKFLDTTRIKGRLYNKVEITFTEEGGGEDFDDVYVYWFDSEDYMPHYLGYRFHVDGGGMRFREAFNERTIGGLRFVDYRNFKPANEEIRVTELDSLFILGELELLSIIELDSIQVNRGNYN